MEFDQNIFLDEFKNKIIALENALIDVNNGQYDDEVINEVFRAIHTIKSTSDLLGMFVLVAISHKAEDVLDEVRNKKIAMTNALCLLLVEYKDFVSLSIENLSMGIFDDEKCDTLAVKIEKEFNDYLAKALNEVANEKRIKTILVVEDSTFVRYMIKKIAIENGYNVIMTDNGEDALNKLNNYEVDLILCDVISNNGVSKKFLDNTKKSLEFEFIPIVMIVEKITDALQQYGKKIHASAWVTKPIDENKLLFVLDKILS